MRSASELGAHSRGVPATRSWWLRLRWKTVIGLRVTASDDTKPPSHVRRLCSVAALVVWVTNHRSINVPTDTTSAPSSSEPERAGQAAGGFGKPNPWSPNRTLQPSSSVQAANLPKRRVGAPCVESAALGMGSLAHPPRPNDGCYGTVGGVPNRRPANHDRNISAASSARTPGVTAISWLSRGSTHRL